MVALSFFALITLLFVNLINCAIRACEMIYSLLLSSSYWLFNKMKIEVDNQLIIQAIVNLLVTIVLVLLLIFYMPLAKIILTLNVNVILKAFISLLVFLIIEFIFYKYNYFSLFNCKSKVKELLSLIKRWTIKWK